MGNYTTTFDISEKSVCLPPENQLYLTISGVCVLLIGLSFVFAGHKLVRAIAMIMGIITGFMITYTLLDKYTSLGIWYKLGIGLGVGLLLGIICCAILKLAVVLLGFALGVLIASLILSTPLGPTLFTKASWSPLVTIILAGVCCAIIALIFEKYLLMIACAVAGSFVIAMAIDCAWLKQHFVTIIPRIIALEQIPPFTEENKLMYIMLIGIAVLAFIGFIVQFIFDWRSEREQRRREEYQQVMSDF